MKTSIESIVFALAVAIACVGIVTEGKYVPRLMVFNSPDCNPSLPYSLSPLLSPVLDDATEYRCTNVSNNPEVMMMQRWADFSSSVRIDTLDKNCIWDYASQEFATRVCQNLSSYAGGPSSRLVLGRYQDPPTRKPSNKILSPLPAPVINPFNLPRCDSPGKCPARAVVSYYNNQYCTQFNYSQAIMPATLTDGSPLQFDKCYAEPNVQSHYGELLNNIKFTCSSYKFEVIRSVGGCTQSGDGYLSKATYSLTPCIQWTPYLWLQYSCK